MKQYFFKTIGLLGLLLMATTLPARKLFAQQPDPIKFDKEGAIQEATKLPDKSPVEITIITIQWVLGFLGLVGVIMILYGGFVWMTSAGNEEKVKKAKDILKMAIIGFIVILLSWASVTWIFSRIKASTNP